MTRMSMVMATLFGGFAFVTSGGSAAAAGDPAAGEKIFNQCKVCHTLEVGKHRVGPSLAGITGRKAGSAEGYSYSEAMKKSDLTWTPENLDKYLADPKSFVPGNKMSFTGIKDEKQRADVIAYLQQAAGGQKQGAAPAISPNSQVVAPGQYGGDQSKHINSGTSSDPGMAPSGGAMPGKSAPSEPQASGAEKSMPVR